MTSSPEPQRPSGTRGAASIAPVLSGDRLPDGPLQVTTETRPTALVLVLTGELDLAGAPTLVSAVEWAAGEPGDLPIVMDMRGVTFIDSTGVRTLLEAAGGSRRRIALLSPSAAVTRVLDLTRLRGRFLEVESLDSAALAVDP